MSEALVPSSVKQIVPMTGVSTALSLYRRILERFPRVSFCFAYGSGVKTQLGYEKSRMSDNVLDFALAIDDDNLVEWHRENNSRNARDYSGLMRLGPNCVSKYQRNLPANVYFNTLVPLPEENVTIKYGVVSRNDLIRDCVDWPYLYLAGRLQKPVTIVSEVIPQDVSDALKLNLKQAVATALLLLPNRFSDYELFYRIAQLSYRGDFRMVFGEHPNKVQNIVKPQVEAFRELYRDPLSRHSDHVQLVSASETIDRIYEVDKSPEFTKSLIWDIPKSYQQGNKDKTALENSLARTVFKSSAIQSIKNIPTAGLVKAIRYSYRKAMKTFSKCQLQLLRNL